MGGRPDSHHTAIIFKDGKTDVAAVHFADLLELAAGRGLGLFGRRIDRAMVGARRRFMVTNDVAVITHCKARHRADSGLLVKQCLRMHNARRGRLVQIRRETRIVRALPPPGPQVTGCAATAGAPGAGGAFDGTALGQHLEAERAGGRNGLDQAHLHVVAQAITDTRALADQGVQILIVVPEVATDRGNRHEAVGAIFL